MSPKNNNNQQQPSTEKQKPTTGAAGSAPKKAAGTRSRTGCWTCRARRKKCDEKRPACTPCVNKGLTCAGYGARLKWGNGVASRGYLTGRSLPVFDASGGGGGETGSAGSRPGPVAGAGAGAGTTAGSRSGSAGAQQVQAKATGRDGDGESRKGNGGGPSAVGGREIVLDFGVAPLRNNAAPSGSDGKASVLTSSSTTTTTTTVNAEPPPPLATAAAAAVSPPLSSSSPPAPPPAPETVTLPGGLKLSSFDETLFREFKEWGAFYLWVSADPTKPPFYDVLSLCAHSRSLLANCLTFQLSLHPEYEDKFEAYYAESLRLFRQDVCEPNNAVKDATLVSGILLCSIGMARCLTWTVHLNGMYSILQYRGAITNPTALTSDIVDTIGFLDLPTHILGRQTKTLNIWHDFCRGKTGVESVSGLPYGLLDIFSTIEEPGIEMRFWTWTGAGIDAKPVQRRAWDAIRFAGIISAREQQGRAQQQQTHVQSFLTQPQPGLDCPATETLVQAIVDCLREFLQTARDDACSVLNLYLYPVFTAGTQFSVLSTPQKACVEQFWKDFLLDPEEAGEDSAHVGSDGGDGSATDIGSPYVQAPLDILHEMWSNSQGRTADQIAREWGLEVGLF